MPELTTGKNVLFLPPKEQNQYIKGTVTTKASTPRSYYIWSQGKTYCCKCQHIQTIHSEIAVSQDHWQPQIPVSQDHQQPQIPVSQDHQQPQILVSQDHCHKKVHVSQDHHHKQIAVSQGHHTASTSQDHQPVITGPSSNITIDQLLQYLVAINGHNTAQQPPENPKHTSNPKQHQAVQPVNYHPQVPVQLLQTALQKKK